MHTACFQAFEESILTFLKGQARARGWSDKQKHQNLWTKRGYDLVYKACDCLCGHGHIRKDLDWALNDPQGGPNMDSDMANGGKRKRKKSKSSGTKPSITIGLPNFAMTQVSKYLEVYILLRYMYYIIDTVHRKIEKTINLQKPVCCIH